MSISSTHSRRSVASTADHQRRPMSGRDWITRAKAVPIEEELGRRGVPIVGRGKDRCGACPVCGGRDRFSINTVKGVFNCRGCQARGDVIDFVMFVDGCDFNTACETLTGGGRPAEPQGRPV